MVPSVSAVSAEQTIFFFPFFSVETDSIVREQKKHRRGHETPKHVVRTPGLLMWLCAAEIWQQRNDRGWFDRNMKPVGRRGKHTTVGVTGMKGRAIWEGRADRLIRRTEHVGAATVVAKNKSVTIRR